MPDLSGTGRTADLAATGCDAFFPVLCPPYLQFRTNPKLAKPTTFSQSPGGDPMSAHAATPPVITTSDAGGTIVRDLETLRSEKIAFNRDVLKLPEKKAREWADRTVRIIEEGEREK